MSNKNYSTVFAALLGTLVLLGLAGLSARAAEPSAPVRLDAQLAAGVRLRSVSIAEDHAVNVDGRATGFENACLPVRIFVDGEREPWWPVYRCLQVADDGGWTLRIPTDDGGIPVGIHLQVGE